MPRSPRAEFPPPALVTGTAELDALCARLRTQRFVTVDTEFMRERTYWPELCLVQLAGEAEVAVVDALAPGLDLGALGALLADTAVEKVFHAARQDIEIFVLRFGDVPRPLFDTQVAAMVAGFGDQVGYDSLVSALTGGHIDKAHRFSDWSARPLSPAQIAYAAADVTHLRHVYEHLRARLEKEGKARLGRRGDGSAHQPGHLPPRPRDCCGSGCARAPTTAACWACCVPSPPGANGKRSVPTSRATACSRTKPCWRSPPPRPKTPEQLARARGVTRGFAEGRIGASLLAAIAEARALPDDALPAALASRDGPRPSPALVSLLKVLLAAKCEQHHVAPKLVASSDDIDRLASEDAPDLPVQHGWRHEVFGADAQALKQGRIALGVEGKRIRLIEAST